MPIETWQKRHEALKKLLPENIPEDAVLYVTGGAKNFYIHVDIDGMILAQDMGFATLNGYSGNFPKAYPIMHPCRSYRERIQHYAKFAGLSEQETEEIAKRVVIIRLYPLKSAGKIELMSGHFGMTGLEYDRMYILVSKTGRFITARNHRNLLKVAVRRFDNGFEFSYAGKSPLFVADTLAPDASDIFKIWSDHVEMDIFHAYSSWFEDIAGEECMLCRWSRNSSRTASRPGHPDFPLLFTDGAPVYIVSEASLNDLNRRLFQPVSMDSFRPTLVAGGAGPYEEDIWDVVCAGSAIFRRIEESDKCPMVRLIPDTAESYPDGEPTATLRTYRNSERGVLFGSYYRVEQSGTVTCGDTVSVK
ncbi:hypothetical protein CHS0354_035231 [Potamilus streckersoni]|uniref:MOSC domain-containing protein n=1 Tax=Potamilus streckersoni TaxID=2493646 RepID=A0AAE0S2G6_9BIVA|nr:hypothetical protein CHS0354_035231 [Potamilus streckersoni]